MDSTRLTDSKYKQLSGLQGRQKLVGTTEVLYSVLYMQKVDRRDAWTILSTRTARVARVEKSVARSDRQNRHWRVDLTYRQAGGQYGRQTGWIGRRTRWQVYKQNWQFDRQIKVLLMLCVLQATNAVHKSSCIETYYQCGMQNTRYSYYINPI